MNMEQAALHYAATVLRWNEINIQANRSGLREDRLEERRALDEMYAAQNQLNEIAYRMALATFE